MTYFAATIRPAEYPRLGAVVIRRQDEIVRQTGEPLALPRTVELLREATNNFTETDNALARKVDTLLEQLLAVKGFASSGKAPERIVEAPAATTDPAGLFGGAAMPDREKTKRLRLLQLREKERTRKIAILKLKSQTT